MKGICCICSKQTGQIGSHVRTLHNLTKKEYYDKFLRKKKEGICEECGKETKWHEQWLYWRFCSKKCARQYNLKHTNVTENQKRSREQTCLKKFGVKHPFQSIEFQKMCKARMIEKYGAVNPSSIPEFVLKRVRSFQRSKAYKLPSGKIVHIQGYEPQFLNYIFSNNLLKEDEIDYGPKPILYQIIGESFKRSYYPDFYIPKFNLIVEIKSDFVRDKLDTYYLEKRDTTIKSGFDYICIVNNNFEEFTDKYFRSIL